MVGNPAIQSKWGTERWEQEIGAQVRRARLADNLTQADLADLANVGLSAVRSLEAGQGSTLRTLIGVVRALGLDEWLGSLSPDPGVDPIALADAMRRSSPRRRASSRGGG